MKYLVCNWKANKTEKETIKWFTEISAFDFKKLKGIEIIVCPSFAFLSVAKKEIVRNKLPIKLGAQNISRFEEGPYTGVVTARMLKDLVNYVLIGHSERRRLLGETDELIIEKTAIVLKNNLIPIICFSNLKQTELWSSGVKEVKNIENCLFLYEPIEAIGSGKPENPEKTEKMIKEIKKIVGELPVLYGGSVTSENINTYFKNENIDGVAVGGASLDPKSFLNILKNVAEI